MFLGIGRKVNSEIIFKDLILQRDYISNGICIRGGSGWLERSDSPLIAAGATLPVSVQLLLIHTHENRGSRTLNTHLGFKNT